MFIYVAKIGLHLSKIDTEPQILMSDLKNLMQDVKYLTYWVEASMTSNFDAFRQILLQISLFGLWVTLAAI